MEASTVFDETPSVQELYDFMKINPGVRISGKPLPFQIKKAINDGPDSSRQGDQIRISLMNYAGENPRLCREMAKAVELLGYHVVRKTYFKNRETIENFLVYSRDPGLSSPSPKFSDYDRKKGYVTSFHSTFGQFVIVSGMEGEHRSLEFLDAYLKMVNKDYREAFGPVSQKPAEKSLSRKVYELIRRIF